MHASITPSEVSVHSAFSRIAKFKSNETMTGSRTRENENTQFSTLLSGSWSPYMLSKKNLVFSENRNSRIWIIFEFNEKMAKSFVLFFFFSLSNLFCGIVQNSRTNNRERVSRDSEQKSAFNCFPRTFGSTGLKSGYDSKLSMSLRAFSLSACTTTLHNPISWQFFLFLVNYYEKTRFTVQIAFVHENLSSRIE